MILQKYYTPSRNNDRCDIMINVQNCLKCDRACGNMQKMRISTTLYIFNTSAKFHKNRSS